MGLNEKDEVHGEIQNVERSSEVLADIDHEAEDKLIRKMDMYIVPTVMMTYLLCFLDRTNIGNARLFSLEEDLGLKGDQFQIAVSILFVTYVLVEVPRNLLIKRLRPSRWIGFITFGWGVVATLMGVVQSFGGLVACRLLLGLLEGGMFPGLVVYLTMFYTKKQLALRMAYLFVASALAGAFGGLLAYGIGFMDGIAGQSGWRWIFIIEGIPTVLWGIALYFLLADEPESAWFLTKDERLLLVARLKRQTGFHDEFDKEDAILALKDFKTWLFALGQFGLNSMLYRLGHWSVSQSQALAAPCYLLGAICYMIVAKLSDVYQLRGPFQISALTVCIIGYGLLLADVSTSVHYFACFVVASGLFAATGLPAAWLPANNPRYGKRTLASAIQITVCNCAGISAPFLYPKADGPRFIMGYSTTIALLSLSLSVFSFLTLYLASQNKKRRAGLEDHKIAGMTEEEIAALGDKSPRFIYTI